MTRLNPDFHHLRFWRFHISWWKGGNVYFNYSAIGVLKQIVWKRL